MALIMTPALLTPAAYYFLPEGVPSWYCALIKVAVTLDVRLRRLEGGEDPGCYDLILVPARIPPDGSSCTCGDDNDILRDAVDLRRCLSVRNYFLCYSPGNPTGSEPVKQRRLGLVIVSDLACFLRACAATAELLSEGATEYILQLGVKSRARYLIHELRNRSDQRLLEESAACVAEARKAKLVGGTGPISSKEALVAALKAILNGGGLA